MLKHVLAAAGLVMVAGVATAATTAEDPIDARQQLMKNVSAAMQVAAHMARGEAPFEPRAAQLALRTINSSIIGFVELLPEESDTGDTRALPAIWNNWDDFVSKAESLRLASQRAIEAEPADLDEFRPLLAEVGQNCSGCHETYRRPED